MLVKHKWIHMLDNWVTLGHPPNGTTINLHIVLKPDRENALINALQEVSQPRHPKYVLFDTPLFKVY
jgi:tripeptidyl-peptidase-1